MFFFYYSLVLLPDLLGQLDCPGPQGGLRVEAGGNLQLYQRPRLPFLLLHLPGTEPSYQDQKKSKHAGEATKVVRPK
jgi:hypothetical protein